MNADATIAASGMVIGVRQWKADGALTHATAPIDSAITLVSSTVVNVRPKMEPGTARSKGDTAATSSRLAGSAHEPARARASDTRGMEKTATSAKSACRSAIQVPIETGTDGAFNDALGRKL